MQRVTRRRRKLNGLEKTREINSAETLNKTTRKKHALIYPGVCAIATN